MVSKSLSISPDNSKVVFVGNDEENKTRSLKTAELNGSGKVEILLTKSRNEMIFDYPAWSPDGNSVAFFAQTAEKTNNYKDSKVIPTIFDLRTNQLREMTAES